MGFVAVTFVTLYYRAYPGSISDKAHLRYMVEDNEFINGKQRHKKTTAEILDIYRCRDVVEKSFDNLKNELDMKRLRSHRSETAQGKLFVAFIALIVRSYLLRHLKDYMRENTCTLRKLLLELDKLKSLCVPGGREARLLNPPTLRQREIYDTLALPLPLRIG